MIWAFPEILATPASAQAAVDSSRCIPLDGPSSPASSAVDQQFTRTTRTADPARRTPSAAAASCMPVGPAAPEPPRPRPRHHPRCPGSALCSGDTARRGPPAGRHPAQRAHVLLCWVPATPTSIPPYRFEGGSAIHVALGHSRSAEAQCRPESLARQNNPLVRAAQD